MQVVCSKWKTRKSEVWSANRSDQVGNYINLTKSTPCHVGLPNGFIWEPILPKVHWNVCRATSWQVIGSKWSLPGLRPNPLHVFHSAPPELLWTGKMQCFLILSLILVVFYSWLQFAKFCWCDNLTICVVFIVTCAPWPMANSQKKRLAPKKISCSSKLVTRERFPHS